MGRCSLPVLPLVSLARDRLVAAYTLTNYDPTGLRGGAKFSSESCLDGTSTNPHTLSLSSLFTR